MKKIAIVVTAMALSACAPRYYDRYDRSGYDGPRGHIEYSDRDRHDDSYNRSRDYDRSRDRDYDRF